MSTSCVKLYITGAIYVKHYPDKIVVENPGGFPEGITEKNIITHPSVPRNKLIAETLQRLRYVQRTGQGVDIIYREMLSMRKTYPEYHAFHDSITLTIYNSIDDQAFVKFITQEQEKQQRIMPLSELMILRYLTDNKKVLLSKLRELTQCSFDEVKRSCNHLIETGLIELTGKHYMLSAKAYETLKSEVAYARDKSVQYIKAKNMILEYLSDNKTITNSTIQELCGFTKQQARSVIDKMRNEDILAIMPAGKIQNISK